MGARACAAVLLASGVLVAQLPPDAMAQSQSRISITAPKQVAPGKSFVVKTRVTLAGPDQAFVTGGFIDFARMNPAPSRGKCPATPAGTYAADTPQSPQPPGVLRSNIKARNTVKRTGTLRFCIWVINATTGEQDNAGAAYIKAIAPRKKRHVRSAALRGTYRGQTAQLRHPIQFRIANRRISGLVYTAEFRCSDGLTVSWSTHVARFAIAPDGSFNATPAPFGTQNDVATIQGRVNGGRVTGSLSETYTSVLGNTCRTGRVKFSAARPRR
jgi:hypothetical protein